uniref:Choline kinase 2 n=1 Tax=Kalanchoe fedtschenkoi TaxID=63787 RepID=A0A7N0VGB2_KALFE
MGVGENSAKSKEGSLPKEVISQLQSLASEWSDVTDSKALQVIPLKGVMTNEVYQIKWPSNTQEASRKVLVRVYGEGVSIFFDRTDEIKMFEFMSRQGQGPRLLGRFSNGRLEEFIHARLSQWLEDVEKYTLASHIFWGLWGMISAHVNEIDFDYKEYARQRLKCYWSRRDTLLGSSCRSPTENGGESLVYQAQPPKKTGILKTLKKVLSSGSKKG